MRLRKRAGSAEAPPARRFERRLGHAPQIYGLEMIVAGTLDHVHLLFLGQVDELDRVTGNANGEVCVLGFFGVFHAVDQLLGAEHVDIQVVSALEEVGVHDLDEIFDSFLLGVSEGGRVDRLGIGDTVERLFVGEFGDGVERSEQAVFLGAVGGVGTRGERLAGGTAVGHGSGRLSIDDIGGDRQDGSRRFRIPIGRVLPDKRNEFAEQPACDIVCAIVVVSVAGEVALDLVVDCETVFIADDGHLCVLDCGEGVDGVGESGDTGCEGAADIGIDERHFGGLVVVLVVHVVNQVERIHVQACEPFEHQLVLREDLVVFQDAGGDRCSRRSDLCARLFIDTAVDGIQESLGEVGAGAEELHFLTRLGCGDATADGVIITPHAAHDVVVLVLDRGGVDRNLGGVVAEVFRQTIGVEDRHVGFRGGAHGFQGMEDAVIVLGDHGTAVVSEAGDGERGPDRVAGEQLVVSGDTREFDHAELHDEVVDDLLCVGLGDEAVAQIAFHVDIEERGNASDGHCGAVLRLDGGEISEVGPLDGLAGIGGGTGDIESVGSCHFLHLTEAADLIGDFLTEADHIGQHGAVAAVGEILLFALNEEIDAVESHAAIIANDTAAAVGVGKTGNDFVFTSGANLGRIGIEDTLIVGLVIIRKDLVELGIGRIAVGLAGLFGHVDTAERHESALERLIGLETDDDLKVLVEVTRIVGGDGGDDIRIHIQDATLCAFLLLESLQLCPKDMRTFFGVCEEGGVAVVLRVVFADEVGNIDLMLPIAGDKGVPFLIHDRFHLFGGRTKRRYPVLTGD